MARGDGQIRGRACDTQAADGVDDDIVLAERESQSA